MLLYHPNIHRCEHIKVNGTQCGSPSIRGKIFCYFHGRWQEQRVQLNVPGVKVRPSIDLPVLEDANSVQVALMQVMALLLAGQIEHKTAALLLYGLQTASGNLRKADFEAYPPGVVIDPDNVDQTLMGEKLWENSDFEDTEEEDEEEEDDGADSAETENEDQQTPSLEECVSIPALKASVETSPRKDNWDVWPANWRDELRTQITDMIRWAALHEGLGRQFAQAGHLSPRSGKPGST
jgi:hypothetical protein